MTQHEARCNTAAFAIRYMDNNESAGGVAYRIYSDSGDISNPDGCSYASYALISAPNAEARKLMVRTLLTAFLAGRRVRLQLGDIQCSADSRPMFGNVSLDKDF